MEPGIVSIDISFLCCKMCGKQGRITQEKTKSKDYLLTKSNDDDYLCIFNQFMQGLKIGGILDSIVQQPNVWEPSFVQSSSLTLSRGMYDYAHARMISPDTIPCTLFEESKLC